MERTVILPNEEILSELGCRWSTMLVHILRMQFPHRTPESLEVLDVKTGAGFIAGLMGKYGYQTTGVDRSEADLALASEKTGHYRHRITLWKMKVEDMFFPDESFDVIISRNLAGKELNMQEAFAEWYRVLKPGGLILAFEPEEKLAEEVKAAAQADFTQISIDPQIGRFLYYEKERRPVYTQPIYLTRALKE